MSLGRIVSFSAECNEAAEALGGYKAIDCTLEAFWDGLLKNPYGFTKYESDFFSIRYIVTKQIGEVPPLVWLFTIDDRNVELVHVEKHEPY